MYKAYCDQKGTFEISKNLGDFILGWDVGSSTAPAKMDFAPEKMDFCFTEGTFEFWLDCYKTICDNAGDFYDIPHARLVRMSIEELVSILKENAIKRLSGNGGEVKRCPKCGERLDTDCNAVSRLDGADICTDCGTIEALRELTE